MTVQFDSCIPCSVLPNIWKTFCALQSASQQPDESDLPKLSLTRMLCVLMQWDILKYLDPPSKHKVAVACANLPSREKFSVPDLVGSASMLFFRALLHLRWLSSSKILNFCKHLYFSIGILNCLLVEWPRLRLRWVYPPHFTPAEKFRNAFLSARLDHKKGMLPTLQISGLLRLHFWWHTF